MIEIYEIETWNLEDENSGGELYGTVFKTLILKRKIYLNRIWIQGIQICVPRVVLHECPHTRGRLELEVGVVSEHYRLWGV